MDDKKEEVILVNSENKEIGLMPKIEAHEKGALHRAFSIFVFNDKNELLLQKRASCKYHSPNLWTNTCCSHPRKGETILEAGKRRIMEEMGFFCKLEEFFSFIYKSDVGKGLVEYEYDTVIIGKFNDIPKINLKEVGDYKWQKIEDIIIGIKNNPENYTKWFKIIFKKYLNKITKGNKL